MMPDDNWIHRNKQKRTKTGKQKDNIKSYKYILGCLSLFNFLNKHKSPKINNYKQCIGGVVTCINVVSIIMQKEEKGTRVM
jgi:hypothetical protein